MRTLSTMWPFADVAPLPLAFVALALFGASIVRGYSGFGFSMLAISSMTLVLPPAEVVPIVLLLEISASIHMLPGVWRHIDWRSLWPLMVGNAVGTPIGIYFLISLPAQPLRVGISLLVIAAATLLWRGFALQTMPSRSTATGIGVSAGVLNGSIGIGGPPVVLFYLSSPAGAAMTRASLVAYFFGTDSVTLAMMATQGLFTTEVVVRTIALLPLLIGGIVIGSRRFIKTEPTTFRRFTLIVLIGLSIAGLVRAYYL
ncbi:MAG: sulfite exporter TauE/SafE family protein [Alphaproteobacteria bacterium]|nr:sulfite exporter TauE/SafE family protein [Alphaproteobacteria bacterium]